MDETNFFSRAAQELEAALNKLDCCPYCQPKQILLSLNVSLRNQDVYEKVLRCHNCNSCFGKNGSTLTDITQLVELNAEEKYLQKLRDHWTKLARITRKHLN